MDNETQPTTAPEAVPEAETERKAPYSRPRPAHRTVDPIDDYEDEGSATRFAHESDVTTRGGVFSGGAYRRSRSEMNQLRRDLHYGQYLEIPKGRRDIFASRERKRRIKSAVALIVVIAVLAVVVMVVWQFMVSNWGAAA